MTTLETLYSEEFLEKELDRLNVLATQNGNFSELIEGVAPVLQFNGVRLYSVHSVLFQLERKTSLRPTQIEGTG